MSIEKSSPTPSAKAVTGADPHGRKNGKTPDASGGSGFSALMSLLTAAADVAGGPGEDTLLTDGPLAGQSGPDAAAAVPVDSAGLLALAYPAAPLMAAPEVGADQTLPSVAASALPALAISATATATATAVLSALVGGLASATSATSATSAMAALVGTPAAGLVQGLVAPVTEAAQNLSQMADVAQSVAETPAPALAAPSGLSETPLARQQAKAGDTAALQMVSMRSAVDLAPGDGNALASTAADVAQMSPASVLLAHRGAMQAPQQDMKDQGAANTSQLTGMVAEVSATALAGVAGDMARPQGRFGARPGSGQSGSSGFDGAFGQAMAATHRSDAVFEVPATSAVVADTAVAETVSYWASQGVQTAELELEGFGDSPVEVSIVLNGDQAQIDFRTDQAGVRQVLEAATAQLKELLSNQGLQLAGVSVGTSGKGNEQGEGRRSRQDAKQATLVKTEALGAATVRMANPSVGRSLDLFV